MDKLIKMDLYKKVEQKLNELNIPFEIVEHEPALTTDRQTALSRGSKVKGQRPFSSQIRKRHKV